MNLMEPHSSKRIKIDSESSHQVRSNIQLVGTNLLPDTTSLNNSSSLNNCDDSDPDLDFRVLRWTPIFVDKTMLCRSVMKDKKHRILLTAPPRFGKTVAKDMLEIFFQIVDSEKLEEKYEIFKDLKISKCSEECTDEHVCETKTFFRYHCGKHPIISLDFGKLSTEDYGAVLGSFKNIIREQFEKFEYLIEKNAEKCTWSSKNNENFDIDVFLGYLAPAQKDNYWMTANDSDRALYICEGFKFLIKVLSAHYKTKQTHKKIIILIDEFDTPFMKLLFNKVPDQKIINFIQDLMRVLCKEEVSKLVGRVVIFSVTALGGMVSLGANNIQRRTFLDKNYDYCKFFGFTKEEVEALVKSTITDPQRQKVAFDEIAVWYNNYTIIGDEDTTICNPFSVTLYLEEFMRKNYWIDAVGTSHIWELFKFEKIREKLFPLVKDNHKISISVTNIRVNDISELKNLNEAILNCINDNQVDLVLQFLTECGYFNVIKKDDLKWTLQIPNKELKETFKAKLYHALLSRNTILFDLRQESFVNALESLKCGKEHEPLKYVILKKSVEDLYNGRELPKSHYHFHCDLWMLIHDSGKFYCFSELPIKKGSSPKLDIMIITQNGTGIIIEVKRHERDSAKNGLKQCLQKEYYKAFELEENTRKVENTILMGLHLSNNRKVSIRYLENFDSKELSDGQSKDKSIESILEKSFECSADM